LNRPADRGEPDMDMVPKRKLTNIPQSSRSQKVVHTRSGHGGPEEKQTYSSIVFNVGARLGWVPKAMPWPLYPPEKRPGAHYTGRRVGSRAGLDGRGKSRPNPDSIPEPSSS
jgi:hypothetical protein